MAKSKSEKKDIIISALQAAIIIAFGIVVAVCGPSEAIDTWFGVGFVVIGALLLALGIARLVKSEELPFSSVVLPVCLIVVGSALFTPNLSFGVLVPLYVFLFLGLGIALALHGLYSVVKKQVPLGIAELVLGVGAIVLAVLYINIADFRTAFWIVTGILIAVYGALSLVLTLVNKD